MNQNMGVKLQMGGSDQWGNITTGTEFIRRKSSGEAHAITCPLLTKSDGTKFGKSEGQNIWLDRNLTSPYKFYQFFLNATDDDAPKFFKIFSLRPLEEIEEIIGTNENNPNFIKRVLAEDITKFVHGEEDLIRAQDVSRILFGKATTDELNSMSETEILEAFEGVPVFEIAKTDLENGINIIELIASDTAICPSKSDARRQLKGNAISINKQKVTSLEASVSTQDLIGDQFILVQNGKKNHHLLVVK